MIPESSSFVPMLDQVKTVQDLVELNNQQPEQQHEEQPIDNKAEETARGFIDAILDEEPLVGITICHSILRALEDFHNHGVSIYIDQNKPEIAAQWAVDATKIQTAREAIKDIQL